MKFNEEQINLMRQHIKDMEEYIKKEILPHINYNYETPMFGPVENWGRFDENCGKRYSIKLNSNNTQVTFCHAGIPWYAEHFIPDIHMYNFIKYWNSEAKLYLHEELKQKQAREEMIENFKI